MEPVSAKELGDLVKITERRVRQLVREGVFPKESRGKYDPVACVNAYIETLTGNVDHISIAQERAKQAAIDTELKVLERDKAVGLVVLAADVERKWSGVLQDMVTGVRQVAREITQECGLSRKQKAGLDRRINQVLDGVADDIAGGGKKRTAKA